MFSRSEDETDISLLASGNKTAEPILSDVSADIFEENRELSPFPVD